MTTKPGSSKLTVKRSRARDTGIIGSASFDGDGTASDTAVLPSQEAFLVDGPISRLAHRWIKAKEQAIPKVAEVEALAEAVPARYKAMVLLAAWCSLRFAELAALRRDRVDLVRGEIRVTETLTELVRASALREPRRQRPGGGPSLSHLTSSRL